MKTGQMGEQSGSSRYLARRALAGTALALLAVAGCSKAPPYEGEKYPDPTLTPPAAPAVPGQTEQRTVCRGMMFASGAGVVISPIVGFMKDIEVPGYFPADVELSGIFPPQEPGVHQWYNAKGKKVADTKIASYCGPETVKFRLMQTVNPTATEVPMYVINGQAPKVVDQAPSAAFSAANEGVLSRTYADPSALGIPGVTIPTPAAG